MENKELPAFPLITNGGSINEGLSKREYFAGLAMQGLLASNPKDIQGNMNIPALLPVAAFSVEYADALLAELDKTK